jgi:hypothetical protein
VAWRTEYEINKTKFLLWKDHAHPALKALVVAVALSALTGILLLSLTGILP